VTVQTNKQFSTIKTLFFYLVGLGPRRLVELVEANSGTVERLHEDGLGGGSDLDGETAVLEGNRLGETRVSGVAAREATVSNEAVGVAGALEAATSVGDVRLDLVGEDLLLENAGEELLEGAELIVAANRRTLATAAEEDHAVGTSLTDDGVDLLAELVVQALDASVGVDELNRHVVGDASQVGGSHVGGEGALVDTVNLVVQRRGRAISVGVQGDVVVVGHDDTTALQGDAVDLSGHANPVDLVGGTDIDQDDLSLVLRDVLCLVGADGLHRVNVDERRGEVARVFGTLARGPWYSELRPSRRRAVHIIRLTFGARVAALFQLEGQTIGRVGLSLSQSQGEEGSNNQEGSNQSVHD